MESTKDLYVSEIFYRYKNEYGANVQQNAKPTFPVEYLLVNATHGFPSNPTPWFQSHTFPIENRDPLEMQTLEKVYKHLFGDSDPSSTVAKALSDFHLLIYLKKLDIFSKGDFEKLCQLSTNSDNQTLLTSVMQSPSWLTLESLSKESSSAGKSGDTGATGSSSTSGATGGSGSTWACRHCTFVNSPSTGDCEMCGLPK